MNFILKKDKIMMYLCILGAQKFEKKKTEQRKGSSDFYKKSKQRIYDEDIFGYDEIKEYRNKIGKESEIKLVYNKTAHQLALEIGSLLNVEISRCQFNEHQKDSETKIELLESLRNKDVYLIIQFEMNNNSEQLSELLFMISCCKRSSAKKVNLILPYMPYSNYDKFGNHSYFPTSDIAKLIETAGADQIITLNCSNPEIKCFFNIPFINIDTTGMAIDYLSKYHQVKECVVITPDAELNGIRRAINMVSQFEKLEIKSRLGIYLTEYKRKHDLKQFKYSYLGPNLKNKDVIIVDSVCVTGQTLSNVVNQVYLKSPKRIFSYIPHTSTNFQLNNSYLYDFITTNTVPQHFTHNKFQTNFSISNLLAQCIFRLHYRPNYYLKDQSEQQQVFLQ